MEIKRRTLTGSVANKVQNETSEGKSPRKYTEYFVKEVRKVQTDVAKPVHGHIYAARYAPKVLSQNRTSYNEAEFKNTHVVEYNYQGKKLTKGGEFTSNQAPITFEVYSKIPMLYHKMIALIAIFGIGTFITLAKTWVLRRLLSLPGEQFEMVMGYILSKRLDIYNPLNFLMKMLSHGYSDFEDWDYYRRNFGDLVLSPEFMYAQIKILQKYPAILKENQRDLVDYKAARQKLKEFKIPRGNLSPDRIWELAAYAMTYALRTVYKVTKPFEVEQVYGAERLIAENLIKFFTEDVYVAPTGKYIKFYKPVYKGWKGPFITPVAGFEAKLKVTNKDVELGPGAQGVLLISQARVLVAFNRKKPTTPLPEIERLLNALQTVTGVSHHARFALRIGGEFHGSGGGKSVRIDKTPVGDQPGIVRTQYATRDSPKAPSEPLHPIGQSQTPERDTGGYVARSVPSEARAGQPNHIKTFLDKTLVRFGARPDLRWNFEEGQDQDSDT